jgi:N-acetylglutamate synthase-like GNAT family acetyltransferase
MRHARAADLDRIEPLLARLRGFDALVEKSRGVFYVRSKAFLHFHEDHRAMFADVRAAGDGGFARIRVDDDEGAAELIRRVSDALAGSSRP